MNNSQFRGLLQANSSNQSNGSSKSPNSTSSSQPFKTPILGSRARAAIPMTPRSVGGYNASTDFRRQMAELDEQPPTKKFRSSAAPKGTKLAQGYQDRTRLREKEEEDDKEKRLKALEDMLKLQQIDQATFDRLRSEIGVGGDVGSTHLVKGLDWKLLEKVRKGEDVNTKEPEKEEAEKHEEGSKDKADLDDELDNVLEIEVQPLAKEKLSKTDELVPSEEHQAQVLSRDEILRRLKESRGLLKKQPSPEPELGDRFKKVGSGSKAEKKRFTEVVNGRRREVLLTTDKEGRTKRKVRWLDKPGMVEESTPTDEPAQQVLGMEVPAEIAAKHKALLEQQQAEEDEDDDIFAGIGAAYNPLAEIGNDSESDSDSNSDSEMKLKKTTDAVAEATDGKATNSSSQSRNYFGVAADEAEDTSHSIAKDPTILAALKRAAAMRQSKDVENKTQDEAGNEDPEKVLKRKQFMERLKQQEREDALDLDMGFGESRFGDEEEEDGPLWDGEDGEDGKKGGGRKRGPKKRRGDKNSAQDVIGVLESRKKQ